MLTIEIEREEDGRWIGEVPELPGVVAYGATEDEARNRAAALALRVIADRIDMVNRLQSGPATCLPQREHLAIDKSEPSIKGAPSDRVDP